MPRLLLRFRAGTGQFLRFCVVGGVGFGVDAAVLLLLVGAVGLNPMAARFASFGCAVFATFELNRRWAFAGATPQPYIQRLAAYLGVQGVGFLFNFGVYTATYLLLPAPFNAPILSLAYASVLALLVNFAGSHFIVFRRRSREDTDATATEG